MTFIPDSTTKFNSEEKVIQSEISTDPDQHIGNLATTALSSVSQNHLAVEAPNNRVAASVDQQIDQPIRFEGVSSLTGQHDQVDDSRIEVAKAPTDVCSATPQISQRLNRNLITNKEEVLAVRAKSNVSKLSLGNGLLVFFEKNERVSFHYRLSENGRDTTRKIGDFDSMSIEKAREEAKKFRDFALQERKLRSNQSFKRMLISPTEVNAELSPKKSSNKKHKCFDSMNDFLKFIDYLLSNNGINYQNKVTILLLFLLPIHPRELFKAQWKDLQTDDFLVIPVTTLTSNDRATPSFLVPNVTVYLSSQVRLIFKLLDLSRSNKFKFPDNFILSRDLCKNGKYDEKFLARWMLEFFVSFKIIPSQFVNFFSDMALEADLFKEDVIHDFVKFGSLPQKGTIEKRKAAQMQLLIQWWGDFLELRSVSFKHFIKPQSGVFDMRQSDPISKVFV